MNIRFIVNARSGAATRALPLVRSYAGRRGAQVVLTERTRHACELAKRALDDGCERVVAVGGDGTMNEVASALVGTGATLGLIPCGSGDGLGRHLKIHGPVTRALELLETGRPRLIDTGMADGHVFFTAAGIGFEAEIAHRFNTLPRRGFIRYLSTSAAAWQQWKPQRYTIGSAAGRESLLAFTLSVANSDQYGNDAQIAPGARADDGLLNLTAIPPVTALNAPTLLARLFNGTVHHAAGVVTRVGERFVIERDEPGWLHTDGELHEAGRVIEFSVRPATLRILAP